jgi:tRNA A37 threonylcarbamoyladenosine modification protein TsaB
MSNNADSTITLGIEMSNPGAARDDQARAHSVAFWDCDGSLIASAPLPESSRGADAVMHAIETLAATHNISPSRIVRIIVSVGPGGYTALRIATTSAKMLAHTLGAKLIAVPSARVGAARLREESLPALIALASKKNKAHASIVASDGSITEHGVIDANALSGLGIRTIVGDRHLPASFREQASVLGVDIEDLVLDVRDLLGASDACDAVDPQHLTPIYAREPDAVTQWRERGSR